MFFNSKSIASTLTGICPVIFNKNPISDKDSQDNHLSQASDFLSCNIKRQGSSLNEPSVTGVTKKSIGRFRAHWLGLLFALLPNVLMAEVVFNVIANNDNTSTICGADSSGSPVLCALDVNGIVISKVQLATSENKWVIALDSSVSINMVYCGTGIPTASTDCSSIPALTQENDAPTTRHYFRYIDTDSGESSWYSAQLDNVGWLGFTFPDLTPPIVESIVIKTSPVPAVNAEGVAFIVTFNEPVYNATTDDFTIVTTGDATGEVVSLTGTGSTTISFVLGSITGTGTIRIDIKEDANGITDAVTDGNGGGNYGYVKPYPDGEVHDVDRDAPADPVVTTPAAPLRVNSTNAIEITGTHVENDVNVQLYLATDTNYDNSLGSDTVSSNNWTMNTPILAADTEHNYVVIAVDDAGNQSGADDVPTITNDQSPPELFNLGSVLRLFDDTSYASFDLGANLALETMQTISLWVKPDVQSTDTQMLLIKSADDAQESSINYSLEIIPNSLNVRYSAVIDNIKQSVDSSNPLQADQWNHIAVTYDGIDMKIYINGESDISKEVIGSIVYNNSDDNLFIGGMPDGATKGYVFAGLIDDVRLYNTALEQTAIETGMRKDLVGDETNLVFNTRMGVNSSGELTDVVASLTGTLSGSARVQAILSIDEDNEHTFSSNEFELDYLYEDGGIDSFSGIQVLTLPTGTLKLDSTEITANQEIRLADLDKLTYTPDQDHFGDDSFTWQAQAFDGFDYSEPTTFYLTIIAVNDAPVITTTVGISAIEDMEYTYVADVTDVDDDNNGSDLTWSLSDAPVGMEVTNTGTVTWTPREGVLSSGSVTLTVADGGEDSAAAAIDNFTIIVTPVDDAPVVANALNDLIVDEDADNTVINLGTVFTDIDNDDTAITKVVLLNTNSALVNASIVDNILTLAYISNANGSADITVRATSNGQTVDDLFNVVVNAVNDVPVATEQSLSTDEDTSVQITLDGSDVETATLTFSVVTEPTSGALTGTEPHLVYTPDPDFNGLDSFTYKANDGTVDSEIVTFSIIVNEVQELAAVNDSYTVAAVVSTTLSVLDNDFEPDGETISLESAKATHGTVEVVSGELVFTPPEGLAGTVIIEYLISDTTGGYDKAIVLITVEGNGDGPSITPPETVSVDAEGLYTKVALGIAEAFNSSGKPLPVNLVNEITFFEPGVNYALWEATDANGNIIVAEQLVYVRPLISFNKDQTVLEGERVRIGVALNGLSPDYPLEIPYTVSGSSDSNDHTLTDGILTLIKGTEGLIITKIIEDNISDSGENLIITLDPGVNRGDKGEHEITIYENNIAPEISMTITQNDVQQKTVAQDNGNVVIQSSIFDPNESDMHTYQWLVTHGDIDDLDADNTSFTLDPSSLTPGLYALQLTVNDDGIPSLSDIEDIYIRVVLTLSELGTGDGDGDLIVDNLEGYADADGDGIPDYQDSSDECNVLPHQTIQQDTFLIEGEPGVCLGLGFYSINDISGGTLLTDADIAQIGDDLIVDIETDNIGGVYDFIAFGLPDVGQSYKIVIPQREVIPVDAVYRKFTVDDGWFQFVEDSDNQIHSAPGERGFCPPPGDDKWISGLITGYWCVQLTIEDGGENDADGIANGTIVDPGGTAVAVSANQAPVAEDDNIEMIQNSSINISVVVNDPDGDTIEMVSANANFGSVVIETDGTLTYTPIFGHIGVDTIVYGVSDGNGGVDSAFIYITINLLNSAPVAEDDSVELLMGTSVTLNVLSNDTDVDGDELTVISADAGNGDVTIGDAGSITYTPNPDYYGVDRISYTIADVAGNQATGLVFVRINQNISVATLTLVKGGGSMEYIVALLLLLVIVSRYMQKSKIGVRLVFLIGMLTLSFNTHAAGTAEGWFVGGQIGDTENDVSIGELQSILDQSGFDSEIIAWENSDTSYYFFAGYKFNSNFSLQLNLMDWGDRELEITGSANITNIDNYYAAVAKVYPKTGDAYQLSASYAWPLTESFSLSGKLGLLKWDSDAYTFAGDVIVGTDQDNSYEVVMGLELQYHLSRNTTIFLGVDTVELEKHPINTVGLGVRLFLNDSTD